ncbi:uncharacterized protein LOC132042891 [Lycium ferocissimum]|uniref:uncharacterized protein LOC132042891 n=1 Tax=Lycium ferocissimum TaxID=112874 RepID=UPI0028160854|nr:uncharacterized protein LOC132042891 [Lycium ferocissimum]
MELCLYFMDVLRCWLRRLSTKNSRTAASYFCIMLLLSRGKLVMDWLIFTHPVQVTTLHCFGVWVTARQFLCFFNIYVKGCILVRIRAPTGATFVQHQMVMRNVRRGCTFGEHFSYCPGHICCVFEEWEGHQMVLVNSKTDAIYFCIKSLNRGENFSLVWWNFTRPTAARNVFLITFFGQQFCSRLGWLLQSGVKWRVTGKKRMMGSTMCHHVQVFREESMEVFFIANIVFFFAGYIILYKFYLLIISQCVVLALGAQSIERSSMNETCMLWGYEQDMGPAAAATQYAGHAHTVALIHGILISGGGICGYVRRKELIKIETIIGLLLMQESVDLEATE